jgi:hypothetical protein
MDEHELLLRHLAEWAGRKGRAFDHELVSEALRLRWSQDELAAGDWPSGTAERLLLLTWPAYGERVDDQALLVESLDTLWRFLRATGRLRAGSAAPAELQAEARRAARRMAAAFDDPANRSSSSVIMDFGRSLGITLDDAADLEEAQVRLDQIQAAWNALPVDERRRLMPDPGPKSRRAFSVQVEQQHGLDAEPAAPRGDPARAAEQARSSAFVQQCLALAEWVGRRREVTSIGVLRPAVAREAYQALDLWQWERRYGRPRYSERILEDPDAERLLAESALHAWTTAADCIPLDRLWYAAVSAGLVEVNATVARSAAVLPGEDAEWVQLAWLLFVSSAIRLGPDAVEPLAGALVMAMEGPDGSVPMADIREWWYSQIPASTIADREFWRELYDARLDAALDQFDDMGLWLRDDKALRLTDLGREGTLALLAAMEAGFFTDPLPP